MYRQYSFMIRIFHVCAPYSEESGISAAQLTFEITENIFLENNPVILENLLELKEIGIKLAVDDFGVGYASFHLLHRFPIDILKIDRQLSANLTSISSKKIVEAIIELAYSLDMQCIVEGIETKEQHQYYQTHKVDWARDITIINQCLHLNLQSYLHYLKNTAFL